MSYEGYLQTICENGHELSFDCNEDTPEFCRICHCQITHTKSVDMTNGYEADNPSTHDGSVEVLGEEEYIMTRRLVRPVGTLWCEVSNHSKEA